MGDVRHVPHARCQRQKIAQRPSRMDADHHCKKDRETLEVERPVPVSVGVGKRQSKGLLLEFGEAVGYCASGSPQELEIEHDRCERADQARYSTPNGCSNFDRERPPLLRKYTWVGAELQNENVIRPRSRAAHRQTSSLGRLQPSGRTMEAALCPRH